MFDGIAKFEVQVKPEDLDELNHVNNVVYMRWMEMAAREGSALAGYGTLLQGRTWCVGGTQALDRIPA